MRIRSEGKLWDVQLLDDGTMDTVIRLRPVTGGHGWMEARFCSEDYAHVRDRDGLLTVRGLRKLGHDAAPDYSCPDCMDSGGDPCNGEVARTAHPELFA